MQLADAGGDNAVTNLLSQLQDVDAKLREILADFDPEEYLGWVRPMYQELKDWSKDPEKLQDVRRGKRLLLYLLERSAELEQDGENRVAVHKALDAAIMGVSSIKAARPMRDVHGRAKSRGVISEVQDFLSGVKPIPKDVQPDSGLLTGQAGAGPKAPSKIIVPKN